MTHLRVGEGIGIGSVLLRGAGGRDEDHRPYLISDGTGGYWSAVTRQFVPAADATHYPTWDDAVEAAQEDAALDPDAPWSVIPEPETRP